MARLLTGKEVSASIAERVRADVSFLMEKGITPTLATVRVGNDPGDAAYERGAAKRCEALGVCCRKIVLEENDSQEELISVLESLNKDQSVHGVLLFRPLPKRFDQALIENTLVPEKDIDCMTDLSMSGVYTGRDIGYPPCTAEACMEILDHYGIDCTGKKAVVIGRSLVIGKPAAMMLLKKNATVTVCHTRTKDMASVTRDADILIAAAGRAGIVDGSYVREGQTVIDVGINVDAEGKICGDVDEESVSPVDLALTPVPGGVGTVTTAVLVKHVVEAAKKTVLL